MTYIDSLITRLNDNSWLLFWVKKSWEHFDSSWVTLFCFIFLSWFSCIQAPALLSALLQSLLSVNNLMLSIWSTRWPIIGQSLPKKSKVVKKSKFLNILEFNRAIWKFLWIMNCPYKVGTRKIGIRNGFCFQVLDPNIHTVQRQPLGLEVKSQQGDNPSLDLQVQCPPQTNKTNKKL